MRRWAGSLTLLALVAVQSFTSPPIQATAGPDDEASYGVYIRLAGNISSSHSRVVSQLRDAFANSSWTVIAEVRSTAPDDCSYGATVMLLDNPQYSSDVLAYGPDAAFALPIRVSVFEDENGVHVVAANPLSLNRTIISETEFSDHSRAVVSELRAVVGEVFPEFAEVGEYGQVRDRGLIGRTMGVIAGGPFVDKIERIATIVLEEGETLADVGSRLFGDLSEVGGDWRWGIRPAFQMDLSEHGVYIIGLSGSEMEAKAYEIVDEGNDSSRRALACPGLDHAPAFPVEVVLVETGAEVEVRIVDEMFRMKMYFEDAGRMKFAANMLMPGSIEDEIRDKVEEALY